MTAPEQLGIHWLLDLHGCPAELTDDPAAIRRKLRTVCQEFGLTLLDEASHRFQPQGVTALGLLAESHISIHTWPEQDYVAVDIFTCGPGDGLQGACDSLIEFFQASRSSLLRLRRGIPGRDTIQVETDVSSVPASRRES